jgi:hypothetical protein
MEGIREANWGNNDEALHSMVSSHHYVLHRYCNRGFRDGDSAVRTLRENRTYRQGSALCSTGSVLSRGKRRFMGKRVT